MKGNSIPLTLEQSRLIKMQLAPGDSLKSKPEEEWSRKGYKRQHQHDPALLRTYESPNESDWAHIFEMKDMEEERRREERDVSGRQDSSGQSFQSRNEVPPELKRELKSTWSKMSEFCKNNVYHRLPRKYRTMSGGVKQLLLDKMPLEVLHSLQDQMKQSIENELICKDLNEIDEGKDAEEFEIDYDD